MEVTKIFKFDMAHNLPNHAGLCRNLHGHTYKLEVTARDNIDEDSGMVIDFSELKEVVNSLVIDRLDHSCVIYEGTAFEKELVALLRKYGRKVVVSPYIPTAENMAEDIFYSLRAAGLPICRVRLYETPTSYAEVSM